LPALREFQIQGHKIVALSYNEGKATIPAVFIHGLMANVQFWELLQPPIVAEELCWHSLSLPGHYPARLPDTFCRADLTMEALADVLTIAIRELVGDRPVILVGHSTGGSVALGIAARAPQIAHAVISLAAFVQGRCRGVTGTLQWLACHGPIGRALFRLSLKTLCLNPAVFRGSLPLYVSHRKGLLAWPHLSAFLEATHPYAKRLDVRAMEHYFRRLHEMDIEDWLPRIQAPTFVLAGDADATVPPTQSRLIAERVPASEMAWIEDAGHLLMAEGAAEYQRIMTDWIEQIVGARPATGTPPAKEVDTL
jgi:pimeloyl-ACP methyl ester carboxylesterase